MAWSGPMPLQIAQPRSARYDEIAHDACRRTEAVIPTQPTFDEEQASGRRRAHRGMYKCTYEKRLRSLIALLKERGVMTRDEIWAEMRDWFPLPHQVAAWLQHLAKLGIVERAGRDRTRQGSPASWRLAPEDRAK